MIITSLDKVPMPEITRCFNSGFSDYLLNVSASAFDLENRWKAANVDLGLSVGRLEGQRLVGLLLLATGSWEGRPTAFNAATCVEAAYRGQHTTRELFRAALPLFEQRKIESCRLEVIQQNERAIYAYRQIGFRIDRSLLGYAGELAVDPHPSLGLVAAPAPDWGFVEACHDFTPSWENQQAALVRGWEHLESWTMPSADGQTAAYALVHPLRKLVCQFGVHPEFRRRGYGRSLLAKLCTRHGRLRLINVDGRAEGMLRFSENVGLEHIVDQYEMRLDL